MTGPAALLARLRALSTRERMLLLLAAAVLVVFVAARWFVEPAAARHRRTKAAIPERRLTLARYEAAAQAKDNVAALREEASARLSVLELGLLPGESASAAGAHLQGLLKPIVERPGTRVTSVRALAPAPRGAYTEIAVQVDFQTTTEGLAAILAAIPRHPKLLRVRKLSVTSGFYAAAAANRRELLVTSVVVAGLTGARTQARGAKGDGEEPL